MVHQVVQVHQAQVVLQDYRVLTEQMGQAVLQELVVHQELAVAQV